MSGSKSLVCAKELAAKASDVVRPRRRPLPRQHAEVTGVSLVLVVDHVPVGVVHLDALPNRSTRELD